MQGLQNLGSTCAINSLIQIICRTKKLRDIILLDNLQPDAEFANELKEILKLLYIDGKSLIPRKFINALYNNFDGIFRKGEQIDIGELWLFLFDKIATELSINNSNEYMLTQIKLRDECNIIMRKFNNNKTSKWLETSQGILVNIIKCHNCENIAYNFEPFTSISIDIINENTPPVIEMLRDYLCSEERLADNWKCEHCLQYSNYTKTVKIWKSPDVFVLIVKRFINEYQKNINPIKINKTITFVKGSVLDEDNDINYTLSSIGMHYGILQGGHYTALCNMHDGTYIHYDDLNIKKNNEEELNELFESNRNAYMIVYERA